MNHIATFKKVLRSIAGFFVLSVFSSQCFAQSTSATADSRMAQNRRYIENIYYIFEYLQQNYVDELESEKIYHGAIKGIMESTGDPYTVYLDSAAWRGISDTTEGKFGGVGLSISKAYESTPDKPAYVEVVSPIDDTPGAKAGIQAGDLIISVDGTDTSTITMEEVLDKLRGTVGEDVSLVIRHGSVDRDVVLTRAEIEVPTVKFCTIDTPSKNEIGYIKILQFSQPTAERVQDALNSFDYSKIKGVIIDLRNNPGGLISSVRDVADKFIDSGPIVSTKSRISYENSSYEASEAKTTFKKGTPIVVLINKGSASASEILSGALKDNHLAYLVGQRSYGKGSVQQVFPLSQSDGFKYTVARYYTPSDVCIDKIGIPPDREILFPKLSEDGEKQYAELFKSEEISKYVEKHPNMSEKDIASFAKTLKKKYKEIDIASLRKLVRNEVFRFATPAPLYDLDYDIQLNEAIHVLEKESFEKLIESTKTLKELQDSAMLEEKKEDAEEQ